MFFNAWNFLFFFSFQGRIGFWRVTILYISMFSKTDFLSRSGQMMSKCWYARYEIQRKSVVRLEGFHFSRQKSKINQKLNNIQCSNKTRMIRNNYFRFGEKQKHFVWIIFVFILTNCFSRKVFKFNDEPNFYQNSFWIGLWLSNL